MGSEWNLVRFGELYAESSRNGLMKPKRMRGEGFKFINMGEIFKYDRMLNIPCDRAPLTEKEQESSLMIPGDLLFARQSLVLSGAGKCSIFLDDDEPVAYESHLIRVRLDHARVDSEFVYYFFKSPIGKAEMWTIVEQGAGQAGIRGSDLENLNIPCPSLDVQKKIAYFFNILDNKIQLNFETNQTLESMAQALFKSWFVDFDPVFDNAISHNLASGKDALAGIPELLLPHAQRRLNVQTTSQAFHHLFPQAFEQSDEPSVGIKGWIPKGWVQSSFDKHTDFKNGFAFKSKELVKDAEGTIPVFKMGHIKRGGGFKPSGTKSYFPKSRVDTKIQDFFAKKGDLLMSMTDMKSNMVILGNTALMPISDKFLVNQRVGRIRANTLTYLDYPYLYFYTNHAPVVEELRSRANSGVQVNLSTAAIKETLLLVPGEKIHKEFNKQVKAFLERIFANDESILSLESLRDTLLPNLISGELRIPDAEAKVEELI
jgi:type I restriction enzyme S subunit